VIISKYGFKTSRERSLLMSKIKCDETKPEILFRKNRLVIFIDGEFWHGYNWKNKKSKNIR
jgi:DNA mismatch endonuclease (patch repair protein)